jgi:hypothetical protein
MFYIYFLRSKHEVALHSTVVALQECLAKCSVHVAWQVLGNAMLVMTYLDNVMLVMIYLDNAMLVMIYLDNAMLVMVCMDNATLVAVLFDGYLTPR